MEAGKPPVLDVAGDGGLIRGMQFEIGNPIVRPGGSKQDLFAIALQEHELEGHHAGATVVHIGYPVAVFGPEPGEPLATVRGELANDGVLGFIRESKERGFHAILPPAGGELKKTGGKSVAGQSQIRFADAVQPIRENGVKLGILVVSSVTIFESGQQDAFAVGVALSGRRNFAADGGADRNRGEVAEQVWSIDLVDFQW